MTSVTDLCDILGIQNPQAQLTCIGYNQHRPNCSNRVAEYSRAQANTSLWRVSKQLSRSLTNQELLEDELERLAHLLLCKQKHQGQAPKKVEDWVNNVKDFQEEQRNRNRLSRASVSNSSSSTARTGGSPTASTNNDRRPSPSKTEVLKTVSDMQLMEELKRRLLLCDVQDSLPGMLFDLASEFREAPEGHSDGSGGPADPDLDSDSDDEDRFVPVGTSHSHRQNQATSSDVRPEAPPPTDRRTSQVSASASRPSTLEELREARLAALAASEAEEARASSPLRHSHIDCVICLEPYEEEEFWECKECLNRCHSRCYEAWYKSVPIERAVRCCFCRTEIERP